MTQPPGVQWLHRTDLLLVSLNCAELRNACSFPASFSTLLFNICLLAHFLIITLVDYDAFESSLDEIICTYKLSLPEDVFKKLKHFPF